MRRENSWKLGLGEVSATEAAEALAINTLAPFVLNSRLKPLLTPPPYRNSQHSGDHHGKQFSNTDDNDRSNGYYSYIINVSAMEGKFYRKKTAAHPHTNMAKAALNMMTRTSAQEYSKAGILMNSVDTGWINDEKPAEKARRHMDKHNFQTPLDEVDAAARVLDPMIRPLLELQQGKTDVKPDWGVFLKDYCKSEW